MSPSRDPCIVCFSGLTQAEAGGRAARLAEDSSPRGWGVGSWPGGQSRWWSTGRKRRGWSTGAGEARTPGQRTWWCARPRRTSASAGRTHGGGCSLSLSTSSTRIQNASEWGWTFSFHWNSGVRVNSILNVDLVMGWMWETRSSLGNWWTYLWIVHPNQLSNFIWTQIIQSLPGKFFFSIFFTTSSGIFLNCLSGLLLRISKRLYWTSPGWHLKKEVLLLIVVELGASSFSKIHSSFGSDWTAILHFEFLRYWTCFYTSHCWSLLHSLWNLWTTQTSWWCCRRDPLLLL